MTDATQVSGPTPTRPSRHGDREPRERHHPERPLFPELGLGGRFLGLSLIFTGIGLLFATHFHLYYGVEWPMAVWWGLKGWYLWGAMAPLIVWLSRRLPVSRSHWMGSLAGHLLAALALSMIHAALSSSLSAMVEGLDGRTLAEAVRGQFLKKYNLSFVTYGAIAGFAYAVSIYRQSRILEADRLAEELRKEPDGDGRGGFVAPAEAGEPGDPVEPTERLLVRNANEERFLPVDRIDRVEAEGNYVEIHAGDATWLERRTLKSLEAQLDSSRFLRIHRSHLVNVDRIDRIEPRFKGGYEVFLRDGTTLPLSRTYRKRLEERIGESF